MNKIYKVIYSKVRQCYVVVSEIAKSHGRNTKSSVAKSSAVLTAAVLIALGSLSIEGMPVAQADANAHNNDFIGANDYYWYWDEKANKWEQNTYRDLLGHIHRNTLPNNEGAGAKETGSIAAGLYAQAGMQTVTIGNRNAGQSRGSVFIGEHSGYDDKAGNTPKGSSNNYVTSVGFQSDATGWGSIAIGSNATAKNTKKTDVAVTMTGNTDEDKKNGIYEIEKNPMIEGASVALGYSAQAKDGNIAIGAYSDASDTTPSTSYVSVGNSKLQRRITNVADGAADSDVATIAQLKAVAKAAGQGIHFYGVKDSSITSAADGNNYNGGGATGEKTVAIGSKVVVTGNRSNSVGYANTVKGTLSDVYGNGNEINEGTHNAVVLGNSNKVGSNSVAIGTWDKANATNSVFVGGNDVSTSNTTDKKGWSIGIVNADGTYTETDNGGIREITDDEAGNGAAFAKKNLSTDESDWDDDDTSASATASAKAASFDLGGIGFDIGGSSSGSSSSSSSTSTSTTTSDTIDKVTVVGKSADAKGTGSVSLGYRAQSDNGNIAIGYNSQATAKLDSSKKGYLTNTDAPSYYVSVGDGMDTSAAKNRRITNVADGSDEQDAVTVAQLKKQETKLTSDLSVKPGWGINKAAGNTISVKHNLSMGSNAYADTDATGLILGGSVSEREDSKQYGASTETSVIVGAGNALASGAGSVVAGGLDNVASGANSTVVGGDNNNATASQSAVFGGRDNTASGTASMAGGGIMNVAQGQQSMALGGAYNYALGTGSVAIGGTGGNGMYGYSTSVNGGYSVSLAGGSTGADALNGLAAGNQSVVTTANGTAVGYQATTDEAGTIAFGHDKDDVSGYTVNWKQRTDGQYNADGTQNDYTQAPDSVTPNTYTDSYYNRLVKVAEGQDDHDVVVVKQLKQYAQKDAGNIGSNIKVYTTDENGNSVEDTDASTAAQKANENLWGTAIGTGKIADSKATNAADNGSQQLVTGGTVYTYNAPVAESGKTLNYVSADKTTGQNLTALDTQVKANADTLNDSTHNIKYYSVNSTNAPTFGLDAYTNEKNDGASPSGRASLAAGFITHTDGLASTVAGSYSGIYNKGTVSGTDFRGAAALSLGTVNINRNMDTTKPYSGVANSLIGQANVTTDSNAAIILGAGNTVKNSYRDVDTKTLFGSGTIDGQMRAAVPKSGGQVMVMGGGNSVDKAYMTQVTGVGNTVTGSGDKYDKDSSTQLNYVDGFYTTLKNGKNDYIIGSHNTVTGTSTDKNKSNIVFGDNHTLTNTKNNVILGSLDAVDETTVSDVVSIGHNAKVTKEGGVAIGSGSEATTAAGAAGYDPTGATADTTAAWTSKKAAVSVGTADETRQITGVAAGKEETDAVNVAQLKKLNGMKANVNADNIGKNLNHKADGTAVTDEDKTANENAWGAAIGTGSIAADNGQLVTGKTVYEYNKPVAAEGKTLNYISDTKTTGQNLGSLDAQVGTNTGDISNLKNLSNITETGQTVIKNLSKDAVKVAQGERVTVDTSTDATGATVYTVSANNNGQVTGGDQNLVSGDTVNTAITNAITNAGTATDTKLAGKANVDASNIGTKLNAGATDEEKAAQQTNLDNWGTAIGTGTIASTSNQLVTGKTVYAYNKPVAAEGKTLNYVSDTKTTGQNLGSLDAQVGTNTGDISNLKNLSNITETGQTVIKNLSKDAVKVAQGERVTVDTSTDATGATVYTVSANNNGQVTGGDQNLVSGDTVNTAITNAITNAGTATDTKLAGKANVDASNIGTKLNAGATDEEKAAQQTNLDNWGTAIGTGTIASTSNQLVTGKTVYAYNKPVAAEGKTLNYVSDTKTTGQNLTALDTQVGTNTGDISKLKNLSNISSAGETVIKNLAKGSIGMEDGSHTSVSHRDVNGVDTYKVDVTVDGRVTENNKGIVDGGTVYNAIQDVKTKTSADLANKANVDASNLSDDNVKSWQKKLGNGEVVSGNKGLVTGDTVFQAVDTKANRDGSNLTTDEANKFSEKIAVGKVEANDKRAVSGETVSKAISDLTGNMNTQLNGKANTSLDNITDTGKNVIRDLAKGSVKVIDGTNTTVTTVEGKGEKPTTYAVNVEGKGTVTSGNTGLISGGTAYTELRPADGSYVKQSNTTASNLTALDTQLKTTSDLIHTNTAGDTIQIGGDSKATKIDMSGKDANGKTTGRVITGVVSDVSDPNSAANVGYVNGITSASNEQIYHDMNMQYNHVENDISRAAAGSNALAALHPMQEFDPDDKAQFALGYGHYRNSNAGAVGAFYQPDENSMVNFGVSFGNGDAGINAGVTFKFGPGGSGHHALTKTQMAKVIDAQSKEIDELKKDNADKDKRIDALEQKMTEILAKLDKSKD